MLAASFTMLRCTISNTSMIFDSNTTQIRSQLTDSSCCHLFLFWLWCHSRLAQILPLSEITADNSGPWSDSNPIVIQCLTKTELTDLINPGSIRSYNPAWQKYASSYSLLYNLSISQYWEYSILFFCKWSLFQVLDYYILALSLVLSKQHGFILFSYLCRHRR